jgi:hypothetical protein
MVAMVLGEASAFEEEVLTRLAAGRPDLHALMRRIEEVHVLLNELLPPHTRDWRLPPDVRDRLLAS